MKKLQIFLVLFARMSLCSTALVNTGCPLDFNAVDLAEAASHCNHGPSSSKNIGVCCRYVHAIAAMALLRHAAAPHDRDSGSVAESCQRALIDTSSSSLGNASQLCGVGSKITLDPQCGEFSSVAEIARDVRFGDLQTQCRGGDSFSCQSCLNATVVFIHRVLSGLRRGVAYNFQLSICRDAAFVALALNEDVQSAFIKARCFFGLPGLQPQRPVSIDKTKPFFEFPTPSLSPTSGVILPYENSNVYVPKKSKSYHWMLIVGLGTGTIALLLLFLLVMLILIKRKRAELRDTSTLALFHQKGLLTSTPNPEEQEWQKGQISLFRYFSYKEVRNATINFSTYLGEGRYGSVYKGYFEDGLSAAVKHIAGSFEQDCDEFRREMELLGRLHHRHLVRLKGLCLNDYGRFLIYEYMPNGSLKEHLQDSERDSLDWAVRFQIAEDVAFALEYLHHYCDPPVCHGDVQSSNIFFDKDRVAKLADFGLSHALCGISNHSGTPDCVDVEFVNNRKTAIKGDVYGYGVLLLELITGTTAISEDTNLLVWAHSYLLEESKWPEILDPNILGAHDAEELKRIIHIIKMCTRMEGEAIPSIKKVISALHSQFGKQVQNVL